MQKVEILLHRRPFLISKLNLRKNKSNVREWINLAMFYINDN